MTTGYICGKLTTWTVIGPEVAPGGTVTTSCVADAAVTVARTPLILTAFWEAVGLNPPPDGVTDRANVHGVDVMTPTSDEQREIFGYAASGSGKGWWPSIGRARGISDGIYGGP